MFEVGKTYENIANPSPKRLCVWVEGKEAILTYLRTDTNGRRTVQIVRNDIDWSNFWREYKEPKKCYVSIWTHKFGKGWTWTLSDLSEDNYNKMVKYYKNNNYTMLKEEVIEYTSE